MVKSPNFKNQMMMNGTGELQKTASKMNSNINNSPDVK